MIRLSLWAAFALSCLPSIALAAEYSHRIWRAQDGLPQSEIHAVAQTPDGYLWIGTSGGLVRFDGVRFVVFDRSNTPAFLDDSVLSLASARDGSLWIGTEGGGLLHLVRSNFEVFGPAQGLSNRFVRVLRQDRQGVLWVGTDRGLFRLLNGKLARIPDGGDLPIAAVQSMAEDRTGRLWIGGYFGLMFLSGGKLSRYPFYSTVRSINESRDGTLWFASSIGVRILRPGQTGLSSPGGECATIGAPQQLYEDSEGNVWIGTLGEGLVRVRADTMAKYREDDLLPDDSVLSIFEDREHDIWVGTQDGLVRLSKTSVTPLTTRQGLGSNNVSTIYDDPGGRLWIATVTGGLYRAEGDRVFRYSPPGATAGFRAGSVFQDSHGVLWFGTLDQGIARVGAGRITYFSTKDGLRNDHVRQFHEDRRGNLWLATGSGLARWDGHRFQIYYLEDGLAYGSVRTITELRQGPHAGDLLVGTDGGLNRVHEDRVVRDPILAQFAGEKIWAISEDRDGTVWLGTRGNGLIRWKGNRVVRLGTRDGLPGSSVYQILDDGKGRFWMSSPAGIYSASRQDLDLAGGGGAGPIPVVSYGIAEGLPSAQMNGGIQSAGCRTASGDLWFPSVKGAVRIDPGKLHISHSQPVLIEAVLADDALLPVSATNVIPPNRRKLEIQYTVCNLRSPERISFQYKLEGFDETWTPAAGRRVAYYTNLRPGEYRFRVMATDATSVGSPSQASVSFQLQPHIYETRWFFFVCAALAGFSVWAGLRIYAKQTKDRYAVLLTERTRLAREMHDTVIQGCVGVSTLLEAAGSLGEADADHSKHLVEQARTQIRLTLDEARRAVWDLRHTSLNGGMGSYLATFARQLSEEKGIAVEVQIGGAKAALDEESDRNLLLVAKEAVWNALAHGEPRHIGIKLDYDEAQVRLEIRDDGRGFEPRTARGAKEGHYGILGMRERVERLGGTFQLRSSPGHGAEVLVCVPLDRDRAAATRVAGQRHA